MMKTIKVKIAVAVDSDGDWSAVGLPDENGEPECKRTLEECIDSVSGSNTRSYWIEADLELPEDKIIEGVVSEAK